MTFTFEEETFLSGNIRFKVYYHPPKGNDSNIYIYHRGLASAGRTFQSLAACLLELDPNSGHITFDARGHGNTDSQEELLYNLDDFAADFCDVVNQYSNRWGMNSKKLQIIGHSLGFPVVVKALLMPKFTMSKLVQTVTTVECLEDIAIYNSNINKKLLSQPKNADNISFDTVEEAVEYYYYNGASRDKKSLRCWINDALKQVDDKYEFKTKVIPLLPYSDTWFESLNNNMIEIAKTIPLIVIMENGSIETIKKENFRVPDSCHIIEDSSHFAHEDHSYEVALIIRKYQDA